MLYLIRIILICIHVAIVSVLGLCLAIFRPFNAKTNYLVGRMLCPIGFKILGIKFITENLEIFDENAPCVIVSNHQHELDLFAFSGICPIGTASLGKKSIFYIPLFGLYYWLAGNILIDRSNKRRAIKTMQNAADAINKKGRTVWIMPEGTRSGDRGVLPFKTGAFHTAIGAECKVVPVAVSTYSKNLSLNSLKAGEIRLRVLPPIHPKDYQNDAKIMAKACHEIIKNEVETIDKEIV